MKKKVLGFVALASIVVLGLSACGGKKDSGSKNKGDVDTVDVSKMPIKTKTDGEAVKDGTLDMAIVMDTQFKGIFAREFMSDSYDDKINEVANNPIFAYDDEFRINDDGAASLKLDEENSKATVKFRDDLKWSDGEPVTADDYIFAYEVLADKDYPGVRYDESVQNIVGMDEYHSGKADTISGLKKVDDKTVEITFKEVHPGMLTFDGGIWYSVLPKHYLKDVPVKDMESSDQIRKKPLSYGPFYMSKIVSGESVEYLPNEYYYGEKPTVKKVTLTNITSAASTEALKSKKYDMILSMPTDTFKTYQDIDGYENLAREEMAYTYIGFKLGKWDADKGEVEMDPNAKMANKSLRQAMGYAVDNNVIGQKFYNGLRTAGTTLIPPIFGSLHDEKIKGYQLDLDKANKLLDDAGYKYAKEGDKYRQDPNGKDLVIKFASMSGGETAEPMAQYYIQQWQKIGLNVELTGGRLIDFQAFYEKLKTDDPDIDVYQAAWGLSAYPSPDGLYGSKAQFNYTRFSSEENTKLINEIDSKESFDLDKQKEYFDEWQKYAFEEAFAIPTLYRNEVLPTSDRVADFDWSYGKFSEVGYGSIKLTSENR